MIKAIARRITALGMCGLLFLGTSCAQEVPQLLEPVGVQVDAVQAYTGTISEQKAYAGAVVPEVQELYFEQEGVVQEVHVTVGQLVHAGDVLITLDQEAELERMEALSEQINRLKTAGDYETRLSNLELAMMEVELKRLRNTTPRSEDDIALKELEREERRLAMEYEADVRALQLEKLQAEMDVLLTQSTQATLTAPVDGRVMYMGQIGRGSYVTAYTPMIYLADETRLTVETDHVLAQDMDRADEIYALIGKERYAASPLPVDESEYIAKVLTGEKVTTAFDVDAPQGALSAGEFAAVVLVNKRKENVLLVPANSLFSDGLYRYVYVMQNGVRERRVVETGVTTDWEVQIVSGLQEGEWVYVEE